MKEPRQALILWRSSDFYSAKTERRNERLNIAVHYAVDRNQRSYSRIPLRIYS